MRQSLYQILGVGAAAIAAAACGRNSAPVEQRGDQRPPASAPALVDDTVHVTLGTERRLDDGRLAIRLLERVSDDRCPANALCVRAGEARVRLRVQAAATTREGVVTVGDTSAAVVAGPYRVTVTELHPYPGLYGEGDPQPTPWIVARAARP